MRDRRTVDQLSVEELREALRLRKREERLRRLHETGRAAAPPAGGPEPLEGRSRRKHSPEQRHLLESGSTATYRARPVPGEDEGDVEREARRRPDLRVHWSWLRDKSLLVVELGVLAALIGVLLASLATLREVNQASSSAQALATLTPTPVIQTILPGGHTPPNSPGGAAPEEIPAHLDRLVRAVTPLAVPTPSPEQAARIQIPAINVDAPVLEGDDWETLKRGAGHHIGSANPGQRGNCVISAHNDIYGEIFRDLPDLKLGDEVIVHTASRSYRYFITQKRVIEPTEVEVLAPTSSPVLTLLSCYPYGVDTHRIAVIGELEP